jgi:hypothetical protein
MAQEWGSQWNRPPSSRAAAAYAADLKTVDEYLQRASQSDTVIASDLNKARAVLGSAAIAV